MQIGSVAVIISNWKVNIAKYFVDFLVTTNCLI